MNIIFLVLIRILLLDQPTISSIACTGYTENCRPESLIYKIFNNPDSEEHSRNVIATNDRNISNWYVSGAWYNLPNGSFVNSSGSY